MSQQKTEINKECLERFELSSTPTIIITEELKNKIDFLHKKVGNNEWSGELITKEEGSINDLDNWKIIAEDIFLVDLGTPGFTGYETDKGSFKSCDIIELYEKFPGLLEGTHKAHHIHTHHSMKAFFSNTDWENLHDRALVSNYFLMLIVNFGEDWCAKVAFKAKQEEKKPSKLLFANNIDDLKPIVLSKESEREVLAVMDCKIEQKTKIDEVFLKRYEKVFNDKKEEQEKKQKERSKLTDQERIKNWKKVYDKEFNGYSKDNRQFELWDESTYNVKRNKKINELTEKEWKESQQESVKFELRHAKCFINSILSGSYSPYDYSDSISRLEEIDRSIVGIPEYSEFIDQFEIGIRDHFPVLFPYKNDDDYIALLKEVKNYLHPYRKQIELIDNIIDDVILPEIELYLETTVN